MHFAFLHFIHTLLSTVHISHDTTFSSTDMSPRIILCQKKIFFRICFHFVQIKFQCIYHFSSASTQLGDAKEKVVPRFHCGAPVFASANFAPVSHQLIEHLSKFTHRYFSSSQTRYKNIIKVTFFSNQVKHMRDFFFSLLHPFLSLVDKQDQILYRDISFLLETQTIPYKRPPWPKNLTSKIQYVQYWTSIGNHGWDKIVNSFSIRPHGPWSHPRKGRQYHIKSNFLRQKQTILVQLLSYQYQT